jgi:hypothetical protein
VTKALKEAFRRASELPDADQDVLAERLLAELGGDDAFDRKIAATSHKLASLAEEALAERRAGKTEPLDPERL